MDYRKFLGQTSTEVLPYLGGAFVDAPSRRLRVSVEQPPGWIRFSISGRVATPVDRADPPSLSGLSVRRGHFADGWLFAGGREAERVELLPEETPAVLSPVNARRWHSGALIFDGVEFEGEAEDAARQALEEERGIGELKGVAASLRAAFGVALVLRVARRLDVDVSPREVIGAAAHVAERGGAAAETLLAELVERRRLERIRVDAWLAQAGIAPMHRDARPAEQSFRDRADRALTAAGAELSDCRSLGNGLSEVTYRFMGERFITVVNEESLQVMDAGICLSGSDRMVTLESLPSVIREGYETDQLNITRR
jgi:hypothetical protein